MCGVPVEQEGTVRVHVMRDVGVQPGGCTWMDLGMDEMVFVLAAACVSVVGAVALEQAWAGFVERGVWQYGVDGGERIGGIYYHHDAVDDGDVVRVTCRKSGDTRRIDVHLSPDHFAAEAVAGLEGAVRDCVDCGWRYVPNRARLRPAA